MVLTAKGIQVLDALVKLGALEDAPVLSRDVAEAAFLMPTSVPGVLTSLVNKGLVGKTDSSPREFYLTAEGLAFDTSVQEDK